MKSKKLLLILFFSVILIFSCLFFQNYSVYGNRLENIKINGNKFKIEVVSSFEKITKGLGDRNNLCEKCGMIFEFPEKGKHSFWMKGMKIDLDIIWIDGNEIVYIAKNISHDSLEIITPEIKANKVLEINAGLTEKYGIKMGDRILF